jgi:CHAT domain-containing protein
MHELLDAEFRLAQAAPGPAGPVGLNLSPDETLLEYFISDDLVSVFVISGGGIERVVLPISTAELQNEINLTRYGLSSAGHPQRESALRFHLQRLYKVLLEPVAPLLTHRIVIVPHRCLHDFPFHVLLEPDGRYLAEHYVTTYAPSASAYVLALQRETSSSGRSLIIGADGPDLPAVQSEIGAVAHELPGCKIAMNSSLQEIRSELETASFIHVASHALFRSDDPAWSVLNLGGDVLAPADLMGLKVNADLVTLSACSTGRANSRRNEASGFVRAFSLWGVPTLIASLWEVNDKATSQVMCNFYEGFRRSPDIAENLRQAMLRVKAQFAHPCYWGGFVLIGRQKLGESWTWFNGGKS